LLASPVFDDPLPTDWAWNVAFGDGTSTTTAPSAPDPKYVHTYQAAGSLVVLATIRNAAGLSSSASLSFSVASLTGTWVSTFFNHVANRSETRRLTLVQGSNGTITGTYTHPEGNADAISGTVGATYSSPPAEGTTVVCDVDVSSTTITFTTRDAGSGVNIAGGLNGGATAITLYEIGGSADKQTLTFVRQ